MTNEQQRSPIFRLDKLKKHLYNTIWGIKQLLTPPQLAPTSKACRYEKGGEASRMAVNHPQWEVSTVIPKIDS
jgi:hypothetical protein